MEGETKLYYTICECVCMWILKGSLDNEADSMDIYMITINDLFESVYNS